MLYQIIDIRTRAQVSSGLTLAQASRYCMQNRHYVFLPAR